MPKSSVWLSVIYIPSQDGNFEDIPNITYMRMRIRYEGYSHRNIKHYEY